MSSGQISERLPVGGPAGRLAGLITPDNYKWWAATAVMIGMFVAVIDTSIVNVALPHMMSAFGANVEEVEWVSTGYMLAMSIMMPTTGWLGQRFGQRTLYAVAIGLFTLASMLCGLAWDLDSLIVFRALQGFAGGAIMPVGQAILYDAFPMRERGTAMAMVGMGAMLAPVAGPIVGGYLTEGLSWRAIFYINLPFGILGTLLALSVLRESHINKALRFDWWGFITMAAFLTMILLAVSQGNDKGWDSNYIVGLLAGAAVSFAIFLVIEFWVADPVVQLGLFNNKVYAAGTISTIVLGFGLFGSVFLLPVFLQNLMGYDAIQTGIMTVPQGVAVGITMPFAGRLVGSRLDPRFMMVGGMILMGISLILQSNMGIETSFWTLAGWQVIRGVGIALAFPAMNTITMSAVPRRLLGPASGLFNVSRQLGGAFGIAILGTILTQREAFHNALLSQAAATSGMAHVTMQRLTGIMSHMGWIGPDAYQHAANAMNGMLMQQVTVAAFDDAFYISGVVMLVGIIPALFVSGSVHNEPGEGHAVVME